VSRAAKRATERIEGTGRALRQVGVKTGPVKHLVLSPPPGRFDCSVDEWDKRLKREAAVFCEDIGLIGFSLVAHPGRLKADVHKALQKHFVLVPFSEDLAKSHDLKPLYLESGDKVLRIRALNYYKGQWGCVRADVLRIGGLEAYVEESPHVHVVGYMPAVCEKSDDFFLRTGWVYKNKGVRKSVSGTLYYLLTHHAIIANRHAVTYHSNMAYSKLTVTRRVSEEPVKCKCGCQKTHYKFVDEIDGVLDFSRALDCGGSVRRVVTAWYVLRGALAPWEGSLRLDVRHVEGFQERRLS
jgi:hypothetical protein